jgi:AraC-like DNA-binding protein
MTFNTYITPKHLTSIVKYYWSLDGEISPSQTYVHRTLANHCPELIFHYGGEFKEIITNDKIEKTFRAGIHGQTDKIRRFTAKNACGIFGVMLQPYAIPTLFNISATEIKNELVDLTLLPGQHGKDITEQILLATDNSQRIILINHFLTNRIKEVNQSEIILTVQRICREKGNVSIQQITKQACLSQRQYERKFKDLTGFAPKSFARLVRFKSLVENHPKEPKTLTEIAYDFGYYDQSHFIQDFKQFSGYKPKTYFGGNANEVFYAPQ